jgi:hypothetical protein
MCQAMVRRLHNPSESYHVRKVARPLARPLNEKYANYQYVDARNGIDCYLRLHKGHRSRGWLLSTPSSLARAQAGGSGNFRKNPNRFPLSDMTSTVVGKKEQMMIEGHDVVAGYPAIHAKKSG